MNKLFKELYKLFRFHFKSYPTKKNGENWCVLDKKPCRGCWETGGGKCSSVQYCHNMKRSIDSIGSRK